MHVLITGGARLIGSHLAGGLIAHGHRVRALDILSPQVHGDCDERPAHLHDDIELVRGDVRDAGAKASALDDLDAVYHFVEHYTSTNNLGPRITLEDGLTGLAEWLGGQTADDRMGTASRELADRGVTV